MIPKNSVKFKLVSVHMVVLERGRARLCVAHGCFCASLVELSSCDRDCVAHKA